MSLSISQKKPSDHVKDMLNPPPVHRDGSAWPKPCIIEQHNFTEQAYQLVSSVPGEEPLFQPFPPEVIFSGYDAFKKYTAVFQLRNNDKAMRRVQVLTVDPETITVHQPYDQGNEMYADMGTNKVACGMKVTYIVTFCPESDEDYQSELVVVTDREKFIVPIKCFGRKPVLSLPDEVAFPTTPVKCGSKKNLMIQNVGTKNCTFNITTSGVFSVKPTDGFIEKGCFCVCEITFEPVQAKSYEEELKVFYTQCNQCVISRVIGVGCELDIGLSTGLATAPVTFIGKSISVNVQLINESSSVVQFLWPEFCDNKGKHLKIMSLALDSLLSKHENDSELQVLYQDALVEGESSRMMQEAFSLTPSKGELWPGTILDITITFSPPKALRYMHTAYCVVSGKSDPLRLEMQGTGIGPQVQLIPDMQDLGEIHLYSTYQLTMELQNTGELEAVYRLMDSRRSEIISFTFHPNSGALPPMEVETISIEAVCTAMGEFDERFLWEVDGVLQNLSVTLRGYVGAPQFDLDAKIVDFGDVSYGVECAKQIEVYNSSPSPLLFSFRISKEEGCSFMYSANPESCLLQPEEVKAVSLCIIPMEETKLSADLFLDLKGIGDALAVVKLQAECFSPQVCLSSENLDFGNCLLQYSYTQEIELINSSNVSAWYEIVSLNDNEKNLATMEMDAAYGIVPSYSKKPLKLSIQTQKLGQIQLSVTINVSGKDSKPLTLTISAISCGPSIQIEQASLDAKETMESLGKPGENVEVLDFGKVQVLQEYFRILLLKNVSCIPAELKICLSKKKTVFCIEKDGLTLEPFGSQELTVTAILDDSIKFTDTLKIITEGSQHLIPLKAIGIGSTIVCAELAAGAFDFGKQVTLRMFSHTINVENQGRKQQSLAWVNMNTVAGFDKNKEKENRLASLVAVGRKSVFSIIPEKAIVKSHATCQFTLTGYALDPKNVVEEVRCNVTTAKAVCSHKLLVTADISPLKLLLSTNELVFVQNNSATDNLQVLNQILTCTNVSELPLLFELNTKQPFLVSQSECRLQPSETVDIMVGFEGQHSEEKLSKTLQGSLEIVYTGTAEKEALNLHAEVNYPNLQFDVTQLNFGCVIENTLQHLRLNVQNTSNLAANYHWFLIDDVDDILMSSNIPQDLDGRLCVNQLFDIQPIRGCLESGEEEVVEFSYYAHPGYQCHARAICEVEGGPRYNIHLEAESGLINYSLSETSLDFGFQQFNQTLEKHLTLLNLGKIPINFIIGLACPRRTPFLNVFPLKGTLDPGQKQLFTVSICPLVPEKYKTQITIQISYFSPHEIHIFGEGVFPCVSVDLPRIRNHSFLITAKQAIENLSRDRCTFLKQEKWVPEKGNDLANPQTSSDEAALTYKEPTIDQVDAEIDRLLLVQSLVAEDENKDLATLQCELTETFSGREHASEKKIKEVEKFALNSYLCDFGNVILGESHQKPISISNASNLPVSFRGDKTYLKGTGYFFEPEQQLKLSVASNSKIEFNIMLKTDGSKFKPGIIEASIPLCIKEAPRTILLLRANVTKPLMELSTECLDFDSVLLGQCKMMFVQFHNVGKVPCTWEVLKPESSISDFASIRDFSAFYCSPTLGTIMPNEFFNMEVRFMPVHKLRSYFVKLPIRILHSSGLQFISCKGHSYTLPFSIEPTEVQLTPIIPKGLPAVQCSLDLVNNSDQKIEVYSLDFDTQYIEEENILRENKNYNEEGFLFRPPRQAGQPFWTDLMPAQIATANALNQKVTNNAPRDSWKVARDKILPSKKDGNSKKTKDEPIGNSIIEPPIFDADTPILILHGPPLSGKTTQGNLLSVKFNLPVIDVHQITQSMLIDIQGGRKENDKLQDNGTRIEETTAQEKELIKAIREQLKKPECKHGAIFDGLYSEFLESVSIAKCVLVSVGLQPSNVSVEKDIASSTQIEEEKQTKVWVGNPLVYVVIISFGQDGLAYRYAQIPEVDHAKKKFNLLPDISSEGISYPFFTRFPSQEMLDLFFIVEPVLYDFLGGHNSGGLENSLQNKVKVYRVNGMQEVNQVFEDELRVLPSPGIRAQIPMPRTVQVIKKPASRTYCLDSISQSFSILTPLSNVEAEHLSTKKGKDGGKNAGKPIDSVEKARLLRGQVQNDQISDAGSILDDKMSVSTKTVGTKKSNARKENLADTHQDASTLSIIPEGFNKQTRWIIPPHSKMNLLLRFWATTEQEFDHTFSFQMVNAPGKASFHCKATCARPQISCYLKKVSMPSVIHPSFAHTQSQSFKKDQMLDFGAIPAGVNPEGFPGIQDSEHSIRLTIHNTGLFDLHVDFDLLANMPSAPIPKSNKQLTFFLHPPSMDLKIDEKQDLRIYSYPKQDQLGILEGKLVCRVTNNPEPIHFKLRCLSDTPHVNLEPSVLSFERLLVGLQESKDIVIRNICALPIQWKLCGLEKTANEFTFSETYGILEAMCTRAVHITFTSIQEKILKEEFTLQVFYMKNLEKKAQEFTLNVTAEAYTVDVVVKNQNSQEEAPTLGGLNYGIVKVAEDSLKTLALQNRGKYTVLFSFCMRKYFSEIFTVTPVQGKLEPKEEQKPTHWKEMGKKEKKGNTESLCCQIII